MRRPQVLDLMIWRHFSEDRELRQRSRTSCCHERAEQEERCVFIENRPLPGFARGTEFLNSNPCATVYIAL